MARTDRYAITFYNQLVAIEYAKTFAFFQKLAPCDQVRDFFLFICLWYRPYACRKRYVRQPPSQWDISQPPMTPTRDNATRYSTPTGQS